jgi:hypothetical protein
MRWDPDEEKYHTMSFAGDGSINEGWMEIENTTVTITETGSMHGMKTKGKGKMTFVDPDTMEWTWTMETDNGSMEMRGTSTRG